MNHGESERRALAVFCAALPELHTRAARGFWEDTLDMHVDEVAGGGSAIAACHELRLDFERRPQATTRGGEPGIEGAATDPWLEQPLFGDYRCPQRRCARRADRDERGRPPRCEVSGEQMRFVRQDPV